MLACLSPKQGSSPCAKCVLHFYVPNDEDLEGLLVEQRNPVAVLAHTNPLAHYVAKEKGQILRAEGWMQ
jgi:hypothetical protein